jgi:uncharacterized protein YeaO (DUF488 family)
MSELLCKRIYEPKEENDGFRILADRLWPRGIRKENAGIDLWAKDIAPSAELRKWYGHDPERAEEFRSRYLNELSADPEAQNLKEIVKEKLLTGNVTLLYAAKDTAMNNAAVLKEWLESSF